MDQRKKKYRKKKKSPTSGAKTRHYSDQTTDSPESCILELKNESSLYDRENPETNLKEEIQTGILQNGQPKFDFENPSLTETDNVLHESSYFEAEMSRDIKNDSIDKNIRRDSIERQKSPASVAETRDYSDETSNSPENSTLQLKNESSLYDSKYRETNLKEKVQTGISQNGRPKFDFKNPSVTKTDNVLHESSYFEAEMSRDIKNDFIDKNIRRDSIETQKSTVSDAQMSSSETTESSEVIVNLNKTFKSSLCVSNKPDSKTLKLKPCEDNNTPEESSLKENNSNTLPGQTCKQATKSLPHKLSSRKSKFPQKTIHHKSFSFNSNNFHPKQYVWLQQPSFPFEGRPSYPRSNYPQNAQYFSSMFPPLYSPRYYPRVNPVFSQQNFNPQQFYSDFRQYPPPNIMDPTLAHIPKTGGIMGQHQSALPVWKQDSRVKNQFSFPASPMIYSYPRQSPPPDIGTTEWPVCMFSSNTSPSYFCNRMSPIRTNMWPMRHVQSPSNCQNIMPPVRTNSDPVQYNRNSTHYRNKKSPSRNKTSPIQCIQDSKASTTLDEFKGGDSPSDAHQRKLNLTSKNTDQVSKDSLMQPKSYELDENDSSNTTALNLELTKNLSKAEECQKTYYSKKINLKENDPKKPVPATNISFYSTTQEIMDSKPLQRTSIQSPSPSYNNFMNTSVVERENVSSQIYHVETCAQEISNTYSNSTTQSNVSNLIQPSIPKKPHRLQYQSEMQDLTAASKYQELNPLMSQRQTVTKDTLARRQYKDPNQPNYQCVTESQPNMMNLLATAHYQNLNVPMYQYGTQHQSTTQDLTIETQYQNPHSSMNQYQSTLQNIAGVPQYQNPNHPINQYQPTLQNIDGVPQYQNSNHPINQYQPTLQNITGVPQYQNLNSLVNQYQSTLENVAEVPQYQNPNHPINQYQPTLQNVAGMPQYHNSNHSINQYQPTLQNITGVPQYQNSNSIVNQLSLQNMTSMTQYQNPNNSIYQYDNRTSIESAWLRDISYLSSCPMYDTSILSQQENLNMVPRQAHVINPTPTITTENYIWPYESDVPSYHLTNDLNLKSNISGIDKSEENFSFFNRNSHPSQSYVTSESSQICNFNSYQDYQNNQEYMAFDNPEILKSKFFTAWSVSNDSKKEIYIN